MFWKYQYTLLYKDTWCIQYCSIKYCSIKYDVALSSLYSSQLLHTAIDRPIDPSSWTTTSCKGIRPPYRKIRYVRIHAYRVREDAVTALIATATRRRQGCDCGPLCGEDRCEKRGSWHVGLSCDTMHTQTSHHYIALYRFRVMAQSTISPRPTCFNSRALKNIILLIGLLNLKSLITMLSLCWV